MTARRSGLGLVGRGTGVDHAAVRGGKAPDLTSAANDYVFPDPSTMVSDEPFPSPGT